MILCIALAVAVNIEQMKLLAGFAKPISDFVTMNIWHSSFQNILGER